MQETISRLKKPLSTSGSAFVPILEDPADVLTNIIVLSRDAPEFYDKYNNKVTTLGDAPEWYSEHQPEFIAALDAASGQTSSAGYHAMGVALRDFVLHHGWQQSSALAFVTKIMARSLSPVAALANLVMKAYLKFTDPETAQFVPTLWCAHCAARRAWTRIPCQHSWMTLTNSHRLSLCISLQAWSG